MVQVEPDIDAASNDAGHEQTLPEGLSYSLPVSMLALHHLHGAEVQQMMARCCPLNFQFCWLNVMLCWNLPCPSDI